MANCTTRHGSALEPSRRQAPEVREAREASREPAEVTTGAARLELNEEGFLLHPEDWSRDVALALARDQEGLLALDDRHWAVIDYIRAYWLEKGMAPMIRLLCQHTGLRLREIYGLFPSGPAKGACKLAGLPKPDGCV
jgi:tRNA 2-thiouridine synthesizing protein E